MKKYLLILVTIFAAISFEASASQIGVLDLEKINNESSVTRDIQKQVAKKQEEYKKDVEKHQSTLEAEQKRIEGKRSVLSAEAFEKEAKAFETKVKELQSSIESKQNVLNKASLEALGKVNDEIKSSLESIAKEKGLDIIVYAAQSAYYKDSIDVTDEVLKNLNKKLTKLKVKF